MNFNTIDKFDLKNKKILVRADLNVPLDSKGNVMDNTRIKASLPLIKKILSQGGILMLTSHLGRPKEGKLKKNESLLSLVKEFSKLVKVEVKLIENWFEKFEMRPGIIYLLENTRGNVGEKENSKVLSKKIAKLCDIFINDAFASAHRKEASTYGVAQYCKVACGGPLIVSEVKALTKSFLLPKRPLTAIVGGSKVSTKLTVLYGLIKKVDNLIVGGGIANTFLQARGVNIGKSLSEKCLLKDAENIINLMEQKGGSVYLPTEVVTVNKISEDATIKEKKIGDILSSDMIVDFGIGTRSVLKKIISLSGTIIWNGPLGVFEIDKFGKGTEHLAKSIANSKGFSIAGGGDTISAINKYKVREKINYISTAGGAFLEFLEGKKLPAIDILEKRYKQD